MTTNTPPARTPLFTIVVNIFIFGFAIFMIWLLLPFAIDRFSAGPLALPQALPTAAVAPARPITVARPSASQDGSGATIAPQPMALPGIAQNAATAQAMYDAAVQSAEPIPNVDNTGDTAPVMLVTKPSTREGAGDNVPTAEPLPQNNDQFGTKQKPINILETHTCLHGQVWNGKGCKNP